MEVRATRGRAVERPEIAANREWWDAVALAERLGAEAGLDAEFVCCDVYETRAHVDGLFDVVFALRATKAPRAAR